MPEDTEPILEVTARRDALRRARTTFLESEEPPLLEISALEYGIDVLNLTLEDLTEPEPERVRLREELDSSVIQLADKLLLAEKADREKGVFLELEALCTRVAELRSMLADT